MKWMAPRIYPEFACIADRCRHSCCVGWEIDVDRESMVLFGQLKGKLRDRLTNRIARHEDGTGHFILDEGERCPFLNTNGLCDMINEYGEDVLCQICRDHPRYYRDYTDRTEAGLGLCCEEACRLMLENPNKTELIILAEDGVEEEPEEEEKKFYALRQKIFDALQDRSLSVEERIRNLRKTYGIENVIDGRNMASFLLTLEILDPVWKKKLERVRKASDPLNGTEKIPDVIREQFLFSLVFRHSPGILDGKKEVEVISWVLAMESFVNTMCCILGETDPNGYEENVRLFSSEIEYSEDNPEAIYTFLKSTRDEPGENQMKFSQKGC